MLNISRRAGVTKSQHKFVQTGRTNYSTPTLPGRQIETRHDSKQTVTLAGQSTIQQALKQRDKSPKNNLLPRSVWQQTSSQPQSGTANCNIPGNSWDTRTQRNVLSQAVATSCQVLCPQLQVLLNHVPTRQAGKTSHPKGTPATSSQPHPCAFKQRVMPSA
jgi:hypothetical protein